MNNGTKILEQQLLDSSKRLLAAQRQIYSDAKKVDAAVAVMCLGLPLAVTLVQIFFRIEYWIVVAVDFFSCAAGFALAARSAKLVKQAAGVQQEFDAHVFGIKFENTLFDRTVAPRYAKKYLKKHDDLSDFDCWHTVPIEGLRAGEAIALCQRQNAKWTGRLMGRYLVVELLLAIALCIALALLVDYQDVGLSSLSFLPPIGEWVFIQLAKAVRTRSQAKRIAQDIPGYGLNSWNNIIAVQKKIYDYRAAAFLVPDWFYRIFKSFDEEQSAL